MQRGAIEQVLEDKATGRLGEREDVPASIIELDRRRCAAGKIENTGHPPCHKQKKVCAPVHGAHQ
ncbi:hypothetical protein [Azospirillum melinis]